MASVVTQYASGGNTPSGVIETYGRIGPLGSVTAALATGQMRLMYVTAPITLTVSKLEDITGATAAAATPTVSRKGLYLIAADGGGTLVARTANAFATLWLVTQTNYTTAFDTAGGYPATYQMLAGQRYALAELMVSAGAGPVIYGMTTVGSVTARAPRVTGVLTAQTDLPTTFTDAALTTNASISYMTAVP
jgi:hypothetical protein